MAKPISEDKRNMILNGNLFRAILMLAIPVMINSFIQSMYNLTDTFMHFGRAQCLMRQIQSDHGDRPGFIEHDVSGFRIDII